VLASLGFSHLMRHGEAFRADPIIACLFLATAALLILRISARPRWPWRRLRWRRRASFRSRPRAPPTVGLIFAAHLTAPGRAVVLRRFGLFCAVGLVAYFGLQTLHAAALPATGVEAAPAAAALAARIGRSVLGAAPFLDALAETLRFDQAFWLFLLAGGAIALTELRAGSRRRDHPAGIPASTRRCSSSKHLRVLHATVIPAAALVAGVVPARVSGSCDGGRPSRVRWSQDSIRWP
jgi:hypothetical protein